MSKTVYLIAEKNGFFAFGAGCSLTVSGGNLLAMSPSGFGIELRKFYKEEEKASALLALWSSAIATAPDGALLRWDYERGCVVDELAPDEEVFAEEGFQYCPDCGFVLAKRGDGSFLCDNCQVQRISDEEAA